MICDVLGSCPGRLSVFFTQERRHQIGDSPETQWYEDQIVQLAEDRDGISQFCKINCSNSWT
jgi:hypothetical protein